MTIGSGPDNTYHVRYHDSGATVCGSNPKTDELYAASASGILTGSDGTIAGEISVYCMTGPPTLLPYGVYVTYSYNEADDTIIGSDGVVWNRR